jgi:cobalt-zinc-cadmium efflux system membrane fusion protein
LSTDPADPPIETHVLSRREMAFAMAGVIALVTIGGAWLVSGASHHATATAGTEVSSQKRSSRLFYPTAAQWATLTIEPVGQQSFRPEFTTEGKIAVNEDHSTPIFSPYAGRVSTLTVKAGDHVDRGQLLFVIEATDAVQALNDFAAASAAVNKARSALNFAKISAKRSSDLYDGKAVPLKDVQNAQASLVSAENDARAADTALEAARNRLRILGRSDDDIAAFEQTGRISPDTPVYAPIAGTIVQRKVGPGQYVSSGASDPVYVVGDLSTVWLTAFVREPEAPHVRIGQALKFTVLALRESIFDARIDYVAAALDPATRRLMVRATIDNQDGLLKPEMFASVSIFSDDGGASVAVPRNAIVYDGDAAGVWLAHDDNAIELRRVVLGQSAGRMVEVRDGLRAGDRIVTTGSLFLNRQAGS